MLFVVVTSYVGQTSLLGHSLQECQTEPLTVCKQALGGCVHKLLLLGQVLVGSPYLGDPTGSLRPRPAHAS